jgi:hypothetical protein
MGTGGPFPGGKIAADADHSPPSSAEVENELELYILSPPSASMACSGTAFYLDHQNPIRDEFILVVIIAGPSGRAIWGVDFDRLDAEVVGSNIA